MSREADESSEFAVQRIPRWALAVIACIAALVYLNTLSVPFLYDDETEIQLNPRVHSLADIPSLLTSEFFSGKKGAGLVYRPVLAATIPPLFVAGEGTPWPFHVANVLCHALASALLGAVAAGLLASAPAGFVAGLFFALHPIHTEAVTWISGRSELFFVLLGAVAWLFHLRARRGSRRAGIGAMLLLLLALGSKETAVCWPPIFLIADLLFPPATSPGSSRRHPPLWLYAGYGACILALLAGRVVVLGHFGLLPVASVQDELLNPLAGESFWPARALTWLRTTLLAAGLTVWPRGQCIDYGFNTIPVTRDLWHTDILAGLLIPLAAIAGAFGYIRGGMRRRWQRILLLSLGIFLLAWLPASSLIIPAVSMLAERNLYLPSLSACLLAGACFAGFDKRGVLVKVAIAAGCAALLSVMAATTISRNTAFRDHLTLIRTTVAHCPENVRARFLLGGELNNLGRTEEAVGAFRAALKIAPDHVDARAELARTLARLGLKDEAAAEARRALAAHSPRVETRLEVVAALTAAGLTGEADREFHSLMSDHPDDELILAVAAERAKSEGRMDEAIRFYEALRALKTVTVAGDLGIGSIQLTRGDIPEAREALERAFAIDPYDPEVLYHLGLADLRTRPGTREIREEAKRVLARYVRLRPAFAGGWMRLAQSEELLGRLDDAEAHYEKAASLAPAGSFPVTALEHFRARRKAAAAEEDESVTRP